MSNGFERPVDDPADRPGGPDAAPWSGGARPAHWLFDLYVRPRRFFLHTATREWPALVATAFLAFGVSSAIDRVETRATIKPSGVSSWAISDWTSFWSAVLIAGAIGAVLFALIGGWWYRARLGFCGVRNADKRLARKVYALSAMVFAMPVIAVAMASTFAYGSPAESIERTPLWIDLSLYALLLWSCWVSFRGVGATFDPPRRISRFVWFLGLPLFVYAGGFVAAFAIAFFVTAAPDVANPRTFENEAYALEYPGNWTLARYEPEFDPFGAVMIDGANGERVQIYLYESAATPEEEVSITLDSLGAEASERFDSWGGMRGAGVSSLIEFPDGEVRTTVFVTPLTERVFVEVQSFVEAAHADVARPGLRLIERSFTPQ